MYCDSVAQIVYATFVGATYCFVIVPIAFEQEMTAADVIVTCFYISILFSVYWGVGMIAVLVPELQEKSINSMIQNVSLLDGMHEGLLILKKSDNSAMFCNSAA